jgi:hypothetical protein
MGKQSLLTIGIVLLVYVVAHTPALAADDIYDYLYDDDTTVTRNVFRYNSPAQVHNLWSEGDEDWARFTAHAGYLYTVMVMDQAPDCDAIIYLYHESNLTTPAIVRDDWGPDENEIIAWESDTTSGTMLVRVTLSSDGFGAWGAGTSYTLSITFDYGPGIPLPTISGTSKRVTIGPEGGIVQVPANPQALPTRFQDGEEEYIYTKHQIYFPPNALSTTCTFLIQAPPDIGNFPIQAHTRAWHVERRGNASIVEILTSGTVAINPHIPAQLSVQFIDNGPTVQWPPELVPYTVDDVTTGERISDMRIYEWTGKKWRALDSRPALGPGLDTATVPITSLGTGIFAAAPYIEPSTPADRWFLYR